MSVLKGISAICNNARLATLKTCLPQLSILKTFDESKTSDIYVKFIQQEDVQKIKQSFDTSNPYLKTNIDSFEAKKNDICLLHYPIKEDWNSVFDTNYHKQVLLVGLGDNKNTTLDSVQSSLYSAMTYLQKNQYKSAIFEVPSLKNMDIGQSIKRFTTTSLLCNYERNFMFSDVTKQKKILNSMFFVVPELMNSSYNIDYIYKYFNLGKQYAVGTCLARDLANLHTDCYGPDVMSMLCTQIAGENNLDITTIDSTRLQEIGCNLLYSVGKGSISKPKLVIMKYKGHPDPDSPYVALVGKGITFDTGGLNLKPDNYIDNMNLDKGGAAAVIASIYNLSQLHAKTNVIAAIPLAENAIGPEAFKPTCVLKAYNNKTVEVKNTDAEGRLILADALAYVTKNYHVNKAIDICTLTGACCVALGEYMAGLFSNSSSLVDSLITAGNNVFERCWHLPILEEHTQEIKSSSVADLQSMGEGRYGGASTAAAFLKEFVPPSVQWAHLDIAGPGMYSKEREYICKNGTGFGAQLLTEYLLKDSNY